MTIIMTAVVPDGIVMASESRDITVNSLSEATNFKQKVNPINYEIKSDTSSKIYRIADYWLAYSGTYYDPLGWNIADDFAKINATAKSMGIREVADLIVNALKNTPAVEVGYAFHLAGYEDYFYPKTVCYSHGKFVTSPGYSNGFTRCGLLMDGETTIIRKIFNDEKILFHSLSLNDAIELLELSITAGAKYLQFFEGYQAVSGGPVDIAVITPDYSGFVKHKTLSLLGKELRICNTDIK